MTWLHKVPQALASQLIQNRSGLAAVAVVLAIAAFWLSAVGITDSGVLDKNHITPEQGHAFEAVVPTPFGPFVSPSDSTARPHRSTFKLFENDKPLKGHELHAAIRGSERGAFSNWTYYLLFSSTDQTDPRLNGRVYRFERQLFLPGWIAGVFVALALMLSWLYILSLWHWCRHTALQAQYRRRNASVRRIGTLYFSIFATFFLAVALRIGYIDAPRFPPALGANHPLPQRVAYYLRDPKPYSVIFLGDSRVYCAMHPELIEKYVPRMHGLNLANFTNWFPTQYSMLRDIVGKIPKGTIVVWTIAYSNFSDEGANAIQRVYPVSFDAAAHLLWWGHGSAVGGLFDNLAYYHWPLYLPIALRDMHERVEAMLHAKLALGLTALASGVAPAASLSAKSAVDLRDEQAAEALRQKMLSNPDVVGAVINSDHGHPNSVVAYFRRGGYYRTELDAAFFRNKQKQMERHVSHVNAADYKVEPPNALRWKLFTTMLDIFSAHHVKLIVNEIEEAPFTYGSLGVRAKIRRYMREHMQPEVERRGFVYARADFDALSDADYFDYNHLNSRGVAKYTPMIAAFIKRQLGR